MMTEEEIKEFLSGIHEEEKKQAPVVRKIRWPYFEEPSVILKNKHNYDFLKNIKIEVSAELGNTVLKAGEILNWKPGTIIGLNKLAGETVDLYINQQNLAKAEIIVINDVFAVRIVSLNDKDQPTSESGKE